MRKNKIKMKVIYVLYRMVTTILSEKIAINHRHKRAERISQTDINDDCYWLTRIIYVNQLQIYLKQTKKNPKSEQLH